jgi:hypothetical protein
MDRDEISTLYRGPSIDASYQVSVHVAEGFQRRRLKCEKLTDDDATDGWFSPGVLVSSTNKTDCHNITEILLKVVFLAHPAKGKVSFCHHLASVIS